MAWSNYNRSRNVSTHLPRLGNDEIRDWLFGLMKLQAWWDRLSSSCYFSLSKTGTSFAVVKKKGQFIIKKRDKKLIWNKNRFCGWSHYKRVVSLIPWLAMTWLFSLPWKLIHGNKIPGKPVWGPLLTKHAPQLVPVYVLYRCCVKKVKMAHCELEMRPRWTLSASIIFCSERNHRHTGLLLPASRPWPVKGNLVHAQITPTRLKIFYFFLLFCKVLLLLLSLSLLAVLHHSRAALPSPLLRCFFIYLVRAGLVFRHSQRGSYKD